jgi:hypothetical protein
MTKIIFCSITQSKGQFQLGVDLIERTKCGGQKMRKLGTASIGSFFGDIGRD